MAAVAYARCQSEGGWYGPVMHQPSCSPAAYYGRQCRPRDNGWFNVPPGVPPVLVNPNLPIGVIAGVNDPHPVRRPHPHPPCGAYSRPAPPAPAGPYGYPSTPGRVVTFAPEVYQQGPVPMRAGAREPMQAAPMSIPTVATAATAAAEGDAPKGSNPATMAMDGSATAIGRNDRYAAQAADLRTLAAHRESRQAMAMGPAGAGAGMGMGMGMMPQYQYPPAAPSSMSSQPPDCVIM